MTQLCLARSEAGGKQAKERLRKSEGARMKSLLFEIEEREAEWLSKAPLMQKQCPAYEECLRTSLALSSAEAAVKEH